MLIIHKILYSEGGLEEAAKEAMTDNGIKFIPSMNMYYNASTGNYSGNKSVKC